MTLRSKIILGAIIVLILLLVVFAGIKIASFFSGKKTGTQEQGQLSLINGSGVAPQQEEAEPPLSPQEQTERKEDRKIMDDLGGYVLPFVERFGTYSNQSNFENLEALQSFMTENMKKWADGKVDEAQGKPFEKLYRGVTTKALSYDVLSMDEKEKVAELRISTQRKETVGLKDNFKVYTQDILVKMIKDDGVWLVDSATWQ